MGRSRLRRSRPAPVGLRVVGTEEAVLLQDSEARLPVGAAPALWLAATGAARRCAAGEGYPNLRLRRRLPPLHALPGRIVVAKQARLLLRELPQGMQGRGAGVSRGSASALKKQFFCSASSPCSNYIDRILAISN